MTITISRLHILLFPLLFLVFFPLKGNGQVDTLDDEFDRICSLEEWLDINVTEGWNIQPLELHDVNITNPGRLTMMPYTSSWFGNYKGVLLYKLISGNFVFTTQVYTSNRAENGIPSSTYSLAGAMVRVPKTLTTGQTGWVAGQENYVFLSCGFGANNAPDCNMCPSPHFEVKQTINSSSNLSVSSIPNQTAIIRMARIGNYILVLRDVDGSGFEVHRRFVFNGGLPDTLQMGFVTYTDWPNVAMIDTIVQNSNVLNDDFDDMVNWNPDLIGQFDYARFTSSPVELENLDLSEGGPVSDMTILTYLDYTSEPAIESNAIIWNGSQDTDWANADNWNGGVLPGANDDVIIPDCSCPDANQPVLDGGNYTIRSLMLEQGAVLIIESGSQLDVVEADPCSSNGFQNFGNIQVNGTLHIDACEDLMHKNEGGISVGTSGVLDIVDN